MVAGACEACFEVVEKEMPVLHELVTLICRWWHDEAAHRRLALFWQHQAVGGRHLRREEHRDRKPRSK